MEPSIYSAAFTTQHKPPTSGLNKTLLNSLLQKGKPAEEVNNADTVKDNSPPPIARPKHAGLKDLAGGIPIYFGLWIVTCGSVYTAIKTNSLDTQAVFGMDRSYAVEQIVSSIEWYTGHRPTVEQIDNSDVNDALLTLSITKLTAPFRLMITMMLMNRPGKSDSTVPK